MIEAEEEKRKAVLEGQLIGAQTWALADIPASQQGPEEDFSWDDEVEQEPAPSAPVTAPAVSTTDLPVPTSTADATTPKASTSEKIPSQTTVAVPTKIATSTSSASPRDSEESYDLVSDQKKSAAQTDDDDSDWE